MFATFSRNHFTVKTKLVNSLILLLLFDADWEDAGEPPPADVLD